MGNEHHYLTITAKVISTATASYVSCDLYWAKNEFSRVIVYKRLLDKELFALRRVAADENPFRMVNDHWH